jgi:hypothetical protein
MLSREAEAIQIRSDQKVIAANISSSMTSAQSAQPRTKRLKKLLMDSDTDSSDDEQQMKSTDNGDADRNLTEIDIYFNSSFDCEELGLLQFWKSSTK